MFVVAFSFKSSFKRRNDCRESCSGLNWSERKEQIANQLVPMSPVAKKCSVDRPIRTESTESVTDWANRTGAIVFLPILNTEALWENRDLMTLSDHVTY